MTRTLTYGLQLCVQHPADDDMTTRLRETIEQVNLARDMGFDSIFLGQHYLSSPLQMLQPFPLIARLASESGDMKLAIGIVLAALQNPVDVAEQLATLDVITDGRIRIGLGLGYRDVEFAAFGVPRGQRVRRFVRNVGIITRLLEGHNVTVEQPDIQLDGVGLTLRTRQSPRPPVWLGANSDRAVRRAARLADSWLINPHGSLTSLARQVHEVYHPALAEFGKPRPVELPIRREIFVARTREAALAESAPWLKGKYDVYTTWNQHSALARDDHWDSDFEELARERFIIGDPQDCREQIGQYQDRLGVTSFIICVQWPGMPHAMAMRNLENFGNHMIGTAR